VRPTHHETSGQRATKPAVKLAYASSLWHSDHVVRVSPSPLGKLLPRHAEASVAEALADTRVVLVTGARQSGKSTLVGVVAKGRDAKGRDAEWRNLDAAATRQAALTDPAGFVDFDGLMVIDEIQRVPDLLLPPP
jgi:uncharacterized protein